MFKKYVMVLTSFLFLSSFVMLQKPDPNRLQIFKQQKVTVENFNAQGNALDSKDHKQVFQEIHRVLAEGGRLLIWDVVFYRT